MNFSESKRSFLSLAILVCCLVYPIISAEQYQVFRLVGFEESGANFGTRSHGFNLVGTHFSGDLLRKLAIIHFSEINEDTLTKITNQKIAGILFIVPKNFNPHLESPIWESINNEFVKKYTQYPVFMVWEDEEINEFYTKSKEQYIIDG
jgi:hypothetical protein